MCRITTPARRRTRDDGFSFIELLAYMGIAALLILAAIPQFNAYRQKAVISNLESDTRNVAQAVEASYATNQKYPTSILVGSGTVAVGGDDVKLSDAGTRIIYDSSQDTFILIVTNPSKVGHAQVLWQSNNGGLQPVTFPGAS